MEGAAGKADLRSKKMTTPEVTFFVSEGVRLPSL